MRVPVKIWNRGVPVEEEAFEQLRRVASLPFVTPHVSAMPDVHVGIGATVGTVVPSVGAIIPAAVGVDIGCGMAAICTSMTASDLPENLKPLRTAIEAAVPHGRTHGGNPKKDVGSWRNNPPLLAIERWKQNLEKDFRKLCAKYPTFESSSTVEHLGTLGTGNHFIEMCLDELQRVWIMLHSGSRGWGN
jgi:tRNA-splicing ligase RtcB